MLIALHRSLYVVNVLNQPNIGRNSNMSERYIMIPVVFLH